MATDDRSVGPGRKYRNDGSLEIILGGMPDAWISACWLVLPVVVALHQFAVAVSQIECRISQRPGDAGATEARTQPPGQ